VGGVDQTLWSVDAGGADIFGRVERVPDVSGDGIHDYLAQGAFECGIVDGWTGELWYVSDGLTPATVCREVKLADVNQDGLIDLICSNSAFVDSSLGAEAIGQIWVIAGGTGLELWRITGSASRLRLGSSLQVADLDADGAADVWTPGDGNYRIAFDGLTGQMIWEHLRPKHGAVVPVGDLTLDGIADFFCEIGKGDALIDGRTGSFVWETGRGFQESLRDAETLTTDLNADNIPDIIVGEPDARKLEKGWISVRDGRSGQLMWRHRGRDRNDRLGSGMWLEDLTGDGLPELLSFNEPEPRTAQPANLYAFDPRSGQQLWKREWEPYAYTGYELQCADFNQDGLLDIIYSTYDESARASWIEIVDVASGASLARAHQRYEGGIADLTLVEVNNDGVPDFVLGIANDVDEVRVADGVSGRTIWQAKQENSDGVFAFTVAPYSTTSGQSRIAALEVSRNPDTVTLRAFNAATGAEVGRDSFEGYFIDYGMGQLRAVDWNGDGHAEISLEGRHAFPHTLERKALWSTFPELKLMWETDKAGLAYHGGQPFSTASEDYDNDGWLDPVYVGRFRNEWSSSDGSMHRISGRTGVRQPGIQLADEFVSAAQGGSNQLQIEMGHGHANQRYQTVFSENGTGVSQYGEVDLPLAPGMWLTRSIGRLYPPKTFMNQRGLLDAEGSATVDISVAPMALTGWVGRTIGFAVAIFVPGQASPYWSSGSASLLVQP